ncbi:SpoIIE family protein phosphatase [Streptomyces avermitilis]|uniref:SpoIIE family protein phosphatase n=1 Tax=Streptomyces avermitilis TaxID=33903 RepID=UPI0037FCCB64
MWAIADANSATSARRASRTAIVEAGSLEQLVLGLETGQRGFLITKREEFLQPWQTARKEFPAEARRFTETATSPEQRRSARQITQGVKSLITDYSVPLVEAARRGDPAASGLAATAEGKRRVDALRAQLDQYTTQERAKLAAREDTAGANGRRAVIAAGVGLAASTALVAAFTVFQHRAVVRPVRAAAAAAGQFADGDLAVRITPSNVAEIGTLGTSFNTMAASLQDSRTRIMESRKRLELLYEASVSVGTTLDVEQTARELAQVAVPRFADFTTVDLLAPVLRGEEVSDRGNAQLRRVALAGIRQDAPLCNVGDLMALGLSTAQVRGLKTGWAAIDVDLRTTPGCGSREPEQAARILGYGIHSLIRTPLMARGVIVGTVGFWRCRPEPFGQDDVDLAEELAAKAAVAIDNARRYTRERSTALTLQRNLLPQQLPGQTAVEVASRYLPAGPQTGVGGDWYDVIPLSGSRVALVVGDVVGHGIHASAAMGRLRSAVRTLAEVDLPPEEVITYLDDLVLHVGDSAQDEDEVSAADLGATCMYAVYDPVSRQCSLATAGHPLPAVLAPDGTVRVVSGDIGPPLGIGGLPFEATDLELDVGTVLALYTDGLVETRDRDFDSGLAQLCHTLARPAATLEETCDNVIGSLLRDHPADDVALLLARTHALSPEQVATWQIAADAVQVEHARKLVVGQLVEWGLEEATFITELVVSELVTNAIRYGEPPIHLRLIRDRTLICEVSDASSTTPHLRHARTFDEGGRGLLLVAALTQSWGSRQTKTGKTIWCEQALPCPMTTPRS